MSTFSAKRDLWISLVLWVGVLITGIAAVLVFTALTGAFVRLVVGGSFLLVAVMLPWVLYGTRYVLAGRRLDIHCGPFRWRVPLAEIDAVTPSRNPLSGPAPSLDRLRIDRRHGLPVLISPRDKGAFLALLERQEPELVFVGSGLRRRRP